MGNGLSYIIIKKKDYIKEDVIIFKANKSETNFHKYR